MRLRPKSELKPTETLMFLGHGQGGLLHPLTHTRISTNPTTGSAVTKTEEGSEQKAKEGSQALNRQGGLIE